MSNQKVCDEFCVFDASLRIQTCTMKSMFLSSLAYVKKIQLDG